MIHLTGLCFGIFLSLIYSENLQDKLKGKATAANVEISSNAFDQDCFISVFAKADTIKQRADTNHVGMVRIPGGAFMMGADNDQASDDEYPKHKVTKRFLDGCYRGYE